MKRMVVFSLVAAAAVSAATTATDALALDSGRIGEVCIINGYKKIPVGRWVFQLFEYTDDCGYEACRYFVKWINNAYLPMTANLWLDEFITIGYADCWLNSCFNFPTMLVNSRNAALPSTGFDVFQGKQFVNDLMLTSDGYGLAAGLVTFNGHFPYPIQVKLL